MNDIQVAEHLLNCMTLMLSSSVLAPLTVTIFLEPLITTCCERIKLSIRRTFVKSETHSSTSWTLLVLTRRMTKNYEQFSNFRL